MALLGIRFPLPKWAIAPIIKMGAFWAGAGVGVCAESNCVQKRIKKMRNNGCITIKQGERETIKRTSMIGQSEKG
jgi:hypothetical protein